MAVEAVRQLSLRAYAESTSDRDCDLCLVEGVEITILGNISRPQLAPAIPSARAGSSAWRIASESLKSGSCGKSTRVNSTRSIADFCHRCTDGHPLLFA